MSGSAHMVGSSQAWLETVRQVERRARYGVDCMLLGPSGSGKELLARHYAGGDLITANCAAIPDTLFESELFGHIKGAYSGASTTREGAFRAAHGSAILLDEVDACSPRAQLALLRVLQEREVKPIGSDHTYPIDVRVVSATSRDLPRLVSEGRFIHDLYWRLVGTTPVRVPGLSERPDDVAELAELLLDQAEQLPVTISPAGAEALAGLDYSDGEVRALRSVVIDAAMEACDAGSETIEPEHIRTRPSARGPAMTGGAPSHDAPILGTTATACAILAISRPTLRSLTAASEERGIPVPRIVDTGSPQWLLRRLEQWADMMAGVQGWPVSDGAVTGGRSGGVTGPGDSGGPRSARERRPRERATR